MHIGQCVMWVVHRKCFDKYWPILHVEHRPNKICRSHSNHLSKNSICQIKHRPWFSIMSVSVTMSVASVRKFTFPGIELHKETHLSHPPGYRERSSGYYSYQSDRTSVFAECLETSRLFLSEGRRANVKSNILLMENNTCEQSLAFWTCARSTLTRKIEKHVSIVEQNEERNEVYQYVHRNRDSDLIAVRIGRETEQISIVSQNHTSWMVGDRLDKDTALLPPASPSV